MSLEDMIALLKASVHICEMGAPGVSFDKGLLVDLLIVCQDYQASINHMHEAIKVIQASGDTRLFYSAGSEVDKIVLDYIKFIVTSEHPHA